MDKKENKNKEKNQKNIITTDLTWNYLTYLFNKKDFVIYDTIKQFKLDDVSLYSITPQYYAEKITRIISQNLKDDLKKYVISDFCSCIGGNSFNFIKYFKHVNCVELNKIRFKYLKHNMNIYRTYNNYDNYSLYNMDVFNVVNHIKQDIIFIDPPWNGKDYKNKQKMDLYLNNKDSVSFCNYFLKYTKCLVLKIPNNFDIKNFDRIKYNFKIFDLKIFKLIIIKKD